jgi:hypothetical protein
MRKVEYNVLGGFMKKNKTFTEKLTNFFAPTKWKIIIVIILYFLGWVNLIGYVINFPFYFYYNNYGYEMTTLFEKSIFFVLHIAYLYLISCVVVKLLK